MLPPEHMEESKREIGKLRYGIAGNITALSPRPLCARGPFPQLGLGGHAVLLNRALGTVTAKRKTADKDALLSAAAEQSTDHVGLGAGPERSRGWGEPPVTWHRGAVP